MKNELNPVAISNDGRVIKVNLLIVVIFSLVILTPIITGNVYYVDDYYRLLNGSVRYWFFNGRPLAVFLTWILDFSSITTDTSPLPLIIGLFSCSMLLVLSFRKLPNMPDSMSILLSLSVLISPFLAQGMLYAFDAMAILISVGLAIYAITTIRKVDFLSGLLGFLLIICTLCLYQPSVNYSVILTLTLFTVNCSGVNAPKLFVMRCGMILLSLIFYKLLIIPLSGMDVLSFHRGESVPFSIAGVINIYDNFISAFENIKTAFPGAIKYPLLILFLSGTAACIVISWKLIKERRYVQCLMVMLSPSLTVAFIPGFLLLLKGANFDPRVLGAFSTAIIFFFCVSYYTFMPIRKVLISCLILYVVFSAVFMTTLFRAAVNQTRFNDDVFISIRNTLAFYQKDAFTGISIIGAVPYSPDILPAFHRYPYLAKYFTPALTENSEFRYYGPAKRVMLYAHLYPTTPAMKTFVPSEKLVSGCIFHLYRYGSIAIVNFKMPTCEIPQQYMYLPPRIK